MAISVHVLNDSKHQVLQDLACVKDLLARPENTVWIDTDEHDEPMTGFLRDTLGLHPLTIEDIFGDRVTPKVEEYPDFLYVVVHGVRTDSGRPDEMSTMEIDVVLGKNWVFTHHSQPVKPLDDLKSDLVRNPRALGKGPAFVAHAVIDRLVDCYTPVVDGIDEELDALEKAIVERPTPDLMNRAFVMKRAIQQLRRTAVYQRDILHRLGRGEYDALPANVLPFFRDVYDQFVRVSDLVDSYRELVSSLIEIYMSVTANRTNDIMKVLALISTLMLPLTFIAGVYGMNFDHMPELHWKYGYYFALGLMVVVVAVFVVWFRRRKWL